MAVISVDIDPKEDDTMIKAYMKDVNTPWIFARGTDDVLVKYHAEHTGTIYVIDQQGKIAQTMRGTTFQQLESIIAKLSG